MRKRKRYAVLRTCVDAKNKKNQPQVKIEASMGIMDYLNKSTRDLSNDILSLAETGVKYV